MLNIVLARHFFIFIMLCLSVGLCANKANAEDIYPFNSAPQENQFQTILHDLRCVVCQNQNLADSNANIAQGLRGEVYRLIKEGKSNDDIIAYMVARYGDYILFKPPFKKVTYFLWFAPCLLILLGFFIFSRCRRP